LRGVWPREARRGSARGPLQPVETLAAPNVAGWTLVKAEAARLDGIFGAFAAGWIVSGSFSCGDRPVTSRTPPASTAQTECASGTGRLGEAVRVLVEAKVSPLSSRVTPGLRRSHRLGDPFLRLGGVAARPKHT
jgi:hypothetical protein